jgi:hypothetical protein
MSNFINILPWVIIAGIVAFNAYMIYDFVWRFRTTDLTESGVTLTWFERAIRAARGSMTVVVLKIGTMFWSIVLGLAEFGDLIAMPEVKEWLNSALGARGASAVSLGFILITYFARIRKFSSEPVLK